MCPSQVSNPRVLLLNQEKEQSVEGYHHLSSLMKVPHTCRLKMGTHVGDHHLVPPTDRMLSNTARVAPGTFAALRSRVLASLSRNPSLCPSHSPTPHPLNNPPSARVKDCTEASYLSTQWRSGGLYRYWTPFSEGIETNHHQGQNCCRNTLEEQKVSLTAQ